MTSSATSLRRAIFFILLFMLPAGLHAAPLQVIVTIAPQKYLLERIGGPAISVVVLVDKGKDPHSFEPAGPALMAKASTAQLYWVIGLALEEQWVPRLQGINKNLIVLRPSFLAAHEKTAPGPGAAQSGEHGHDNDGDDPHVWVSPRLMGVAAQEAAAALGKALPEKAAEFAANLRLLLADIDELDQQIIALFAPLPESQRAFLTFHQAWTHYARDYALREIAIEQEGKEAGPKAMARTIDRARKEGITTIMVSPANNQNTARAIADSMQARIVVADPLAPGWLENMRDISRRLAEAMSKG